MIIKLKTYNIIFLKKFNFLIKYKNIKLFYTFIFNFKKLNFFLITNFLDQKYQWLSSNQNLNDFNINFIKLLGFSVKVKKSLKLDNKVYNIINFKKKCSLLKKKNDIMYVILNKIYYSGRNEFFNNIKTDFKNFDFKKKLKFIFKTNREILKKIYNLKYYRNFSLNKNIKNICNFSKKNNFININNNLLNILLKSDFFFSKNDCLWFLSNSLISVNSLITKDRNYILREYDIVNVFYSNKYFYYYKNCLNRLLNNFYKIGLKLWSINKKRFKPVEKTEKKTIKESYPNWLENYIFFKKDIPLHLEVDYMSMTLIMLNYNWNFKNSDIIDYKFFNFYLNRLYNWKFII